MAGKAVESKALKCVACGAPYTLRGFATTKSVACEYCGSIFDTSTPEWQLIERVEKRRHDAPLWPLGTRATLEGHRFDLVGWMKRFVVVDHVKYFWEEHLFFSPFHGYRYLTYQDGHFTLVKPLPGMPRYSARRTATYEGVTYRHFQGAPASVHEVVGEFPWRVKRDESVQTDDFVAPPYMLSNERTTGQDGGESVWSRGVYLTLAEVEKAVGPAARAKRFTLGIAPNQPNPTGSVEWVKKATAIALAAWLFMTCVYVFRCAGTTVLDVDVAPKKVAQAPTPGAPVPAGAPAAEPDPPAAVHSLTLASAHDPANLEVELTAPVFNKYAFCECALVDVKNQHAYPFGLEIGYYQGVEDGETWSEGSREATIHLGNIPNGDYVFQVERDDDFPGTARIRIKRDVALARYPVLALLALLVFPIIILFRSRAFETRRWAESDHGSS